MYKQVILVDDYIKNKLYGSQVEIFKVDECYLKPSGKVDWDESLIKLKANADWKDA